MSVPSDEQATDLEHGRRGIEERALQSREAQTLRVSTMRRDFQRHTLTHALIMMVEKFETILR